jgi:hypothetical protein
VLLLRCIDDVTTQKILKQIHGSTDSNVHIGGHFATKATSFKILRTRYYWPLFFKILSSLQRHVNPPSSKNYFTKWSEVVPLKHAQDEHVISFLESNIFSHFGLPLEIVSNNGPAFISSKFTQFIIKFGVKHFTFSTYYPQGNG